MQSTQTRPFGRAKRDRRAKKELKETEEELKKS